MNEDKKRKNILEEKIQSKEIKMKENEENPSPIQLDEEIVVDEEIKKEEKMNFMDVKEELLEKAADMWLEAKRIVFFTGAGISVESGIPDFRSSGGLWEKFSPDIYAHYETFLDEPSLFWQMSLEVVKIMKEAKPNGGHRSIAELEKYKQVSVITQNIDGLHQEAGSTKVYELHGTSKSASCIKCKKKSRIEGD